MSIRWEGTGAGQANKKVMVDKKKATVNENRWVMNAGICRRRCLRGLHMRDQGRPHEMEPKSISIISLIRCSNKLENLFSSSMPITTNVGQMNPYENEVRPDNRR
jgi:hypothetical protein